MMNEYCDQAVCITAYTNPEMLDELLKCIHGMFMCFVHIDKKNKNLFSLVENKYPDVVFCSDYMVNWGGYEHLEAVIKLFKLAQNRNAKYIHLISGEDYPLIPITEMVSQFENDNRIWISCYLDNGRESKRWKYYWPYVRFSGNYKKPIVRYMNVAFVEVQKIMKLFTRKRIGEFKNIYGGYIWGDYPNEAVNYILKYIDENPDYMKAMKWVKTPEERCFHTIIANSPLSDRIQDNYRRFWKMKENDWGPRYLTEEDLDEMLKSDALFVRKVKARTGLLRILRNRVASI